MNDKWIHLVVLGVCGGLLPIGCGEATDPVVKTPAPTSAASSADAKAAALKEQLQVATTKCRDIHGKVRLWMTLLKKDAPQDLKELEAPISRASEASFMHVENDPWGTPYAIRPLGPRKFRICSAGPDNQAGTDDDICYPSD